MLLFADAPAAMSAGRLCLLCKWCGLLHEGVSVPLILQAFDCFASSQQTAVAPADADVTCQTSAPRVLALSGFASAMAALASHLRPDYSPEHALEGLCSSRLQRVVRDAAAWTHALAQTHPALLSDAHVAFTGATAHRRWLRKLFRFAVAGIAESDTNINVAARSNIVSSMHNCADDQGDAPGISGASTYSAFDRMNLPQALQIFKALQVVPKRITSAELRQLFDAATFVPGGVHRVLQVDDVACCAQRGLIFEEFLDLLCLCAHCVGPSQAGCDGQVENVSITFADSYSTQAKRLWVAEATVRIRCMRCMCD